MGLRREVLLRDLLRLLAQPFQIVGKIEVHPTSPRCRSELHTLGHAAVANQVGSADETGA